jgi:hypothetical protein
VALGVLGLAVGVQVALMGREWEEGELKRKKMVGAVSVSLFLFSSGFYSILLFFRCLRSAFSSFIPPRAYIPFI